MPDASGRFRGISVPRVPWREEKDKDKRREAAVRAVLKRGGRAVEATAPPERETR